MPKVAGIRKCDQGANPTNTSIMTFRHSSMVKTRKFANVLSWWIGDLLIRKQEDT